MEESRSSGRAKRPAKPVDEGSWDCSVCTYKNSAEAYKCEMCDVRKGTSTRKPKINPQIVAQQVAQQFAAPLTPPPPGTLNADEDSLTSLPEMEPLPDPLGPPPPPPKIAPKKEKSATQSLKREKSNVTPRVNSQPQKKNNSRPNRLKNIDRSSGQQMSVTVDNVTVVITDYPPKRRKISTDPSKNNILSDASDTSSNASNDIHEERMLGENHT